MVLCQIGQLDIYCGLRRMGLSVNMDHFGFLPGHLPNSVYDMINSLHYLVLTFLKAVQLLGQTLTPFWILDPDQLSPASSAPTCYWFLILSLPFSILLRTHRKSHRFETYAFSAIASSGLWPYFKSSKFQFSSAYGAMCGSFVHGRSECLDE